MATTVITSVAPATRGRVHQDSVLLPIAGPRRRAGWTPAAIAGLAILLMLGIAAAAGPLLWTVNPNTQDLLARLAPPWGMGGSAAHPLGTDTLGRDTLARLIAGARVSLPLAIGTTTAAAAIGVTLGVIGGYRQGWSDRFVTWLCDVQLVVPFVVFAIAVTTIVGPGIRNVAITLIATGWVTYTRVLRLQTHALRRAEWMEAARASGCGPGRLMTRHLLPNLVAPIVILATQQAGAMILYESSLTFLGLGVGGDVVTWGGMAALGREAIFSAPWVAALPGVVIAMAILGFQLVGDWLAARERRR
ncbi:MAG: ABC transporter permease [Thermomicrobiales bacterium]